MRFHLGLVMFLLVLGLTLGSGLLQGRMRGRWGIQPDLAAAAKLLEGTPNRFGDWELVQPQALRSEAVQMLECAGYLCGTYRNGATGGAVNMFVLLGPPGPIAVHTPDICYSSRDYTIVRERERAAVPNAAQADAEFWALTLRGNDVHAALLRVYYAWSDGSRWRASAKPRFEYGGRPLLYKIQVADPTVRGETADRDDLGLSFLRDFLPVLQAHLVGGIGSSKLEARSKKLDVASSK